MNRPAGENIVSTEKPHLTRPPRQKDLETIARGRSDKHHGRGQSGNDHRTRSNCSNSSNRSTPSLLLPRECGGGGSESCELSVSNVLIGLNSLNCWNGLNALLFMSNLPKQLLPFLVFFLVLFDGQSRFGIPALEIRLVHRAVQAEFAKKLLPLRTEKEIGKNQRAVRMWRAGGNRHTARIRRHHIHGD